MPTPAIFDSAMAGLRSAQAGVLSTSQNVAGASVEGYVRRKPDTRISALSPASIELNGTAFAVEGFTRFYNSILQTQLLAQKGQTSYTKALTESVATLDSILIDPAASVSGKLGEFFNTAGSLSNDPTSVSYRQAFLGAASRASDRIRLLADELASVTKYSSEALANVLNESNALLTQIAAINGRIKGGFTAGYSYPSPDLFDERDRITQRLQELIGGQTVINEDGTANHYAGGLQLVDRDYANYFANGSGTKPIVASSDVTTLRLRVSSPNFGVPKLVPLVTDGKSELIDGQAGAYVHLLQNFVPSVEKGVDLLAATLYRGVNRVRNQTLQAISPPTMIAREASAAGSNLLKVDSTLTLGTNAVVGARVFVNGVDQGVRVSAVNNVAGGADVTVSGMLPAEVKLNATVSFRLPNLNEIAPVFGYDNPKSVSTFVHSNTNSVAVNGNNLITLATAIPTSFSLPDGTTQTNLVGLKVFIDGVNSGATVTSQTNPNIVALDKFVTVGNGAVTGRTISFVKDTAAAPSDVDAIFRRTDGYDVGTWQGWQDQPALRFVMSQQPEQSVVGMRIYVNGRDTGAVVARVSGAAVTANQAFDAAITPAAGNKVEFFPQTTAQALAAHPTNSALTMVNLPVDFEVDLLHTRMEYFSAGAWREAGRVVLSDGPLIAVKPAAGSTMAAANPVRFVRDDTFDEVLDQVDPQSTAFDRTTSNELARGNIDARLFRMIGSDSPAQFLNFDAGAARQIEGLRIATAQSVSIVVTSVANAVATWKASNEANISLEKSLTDQKEAISGVNLDEEAANLVKYQQLYNASSKLLQAGRQMFDTLLSMLTVN